MPRRARDAARLAGERFSELLHVAVLEVEDSVGDVEDSVVMGHEDNAGPFLTSRLLDQLRDGSASEHCGESATGAFLPHRRE